MLRIFGFKYLQSLMMFARIIEQSRRDLAAPSLFDYVKLVEFAGRNFPAAISSFFSRL